MRAPILALAVALASVPEPSRAEQSPPVTTFVERFREPPNVLLFNPGDLLGGVFSVEYERALLSFLGLELGLSVTAFRGVFAPPDAVAFVAVGPELGLRFHFIQRAPLGLWVGPSIDGVYIASRSSGAVDRVFGYGLGAAVGYNLGLGPLVLQLGLGGGFADYGAGVVWSPRLRLGLGGRF